MSAPRHTYEYDVELGADTAPARVIRMTGKGKRVLEVGAGPGSITKHLIRSNSCDVVALEIDPSAIAKLKEYCSNIYSLDLNDEKWPEALAGEAKFDVVIAADVLEHVYNPLRTLNGMKSLLKPDGEIILSLPHVGHCVINACLLDEDFDYREWGLLDKTHIRFFGIKNINKLYADAGMGMVHAEFVVRTPRQTEFVDRWTKLTPEAQIVLSSNPFGFVYQVVSKAKVSAFGSGLDLLKVPVEINDPEYTGTPVLAATPPSLRAALRATAAQRLSPAAKGHILSVANKLGIRL
jgi:2-polyprenyl-3-methyl-5-hydroxy-6-metoxy-1,4-benzoquinol methylase